MERLNLVEEENISLKKKLEKMEEEKMELELHVAEVIDDHKIKMDPIVERLNLVEEENKFLKEKIKKNCGREDDIGVACCGCRR